MTLPALITLQKLSRPLRFFIILFISVVGLSGCLHHVPNDGHRYLTLKQTSELQQGKRFFETGYYKHAMRMLLPLACDGDAESQYAVGYMYYYGFGVAQDTDVGSFWINRSARQGYAPAMRALNLIRRQPVELKRLNKRTPSF